MTTVSTVSTVSTGDMTITYLSESCSARHDVDDDGGGLGERVVHRRTASRLLDDAAQGLVVGVALDPEGDLDLLVAVADRALGETEDADQVDVALHGGLDPG